MLAILARQTSDTYPNDPPGPTDTAIQDLVDDSSGGYAFLSADAICSVQYGGQGSTDWTPDFVAPKGGLDLAAGIVGIRFRSKIPGTPVTVSAAIFRKDEPPVQLAAGGLTALSLTFMHNGLVAGVEPNLDFEDTANQNTWVLTDNSGTQTLSVSTSFTSPAVFPGSVSFGGLTDNTIGRLAAGVVGSTTSGLSTGPTVVTAGGGGVPGVILQGNAPGRIGIFATANDLPFRVSLTGDTQYRWTMDNNGLMSWGPGGAAALDTTLQRSATIPPSSGQVGLTTQQAIQSTNTTGGFVYTAAANNSAFLSFLAASDANPAFKIFTQGALEWGPGGASALDLELARVSNAPSGTGTFLELLAGQGFGYGTGTGGTVTQATSLNTGVTLNKPNGTITLFTTSTSAGALFNFVVTNSVVGVDDTVVVCMAGGGANNSGFIVWVSEINAGSFAVGIYTPLATASASRTLSFAVIKGSVS